MSQRKSDFACLFTSCKQKIKISTLQLVNIKTQEEMELDKENSIRKEIQHQFLLILHLIMIFFPRIGKKRDFFDNDDEYNDYLMDFEDIGHNV